MHGGHWGRRRAVCVHTGPGSARGETSPADTGAGTTALGGGASHIVTVVGGGGGGGGDAE